MLIYLGELTGWGSWRKIPSYENYFPFIDEGNTEQQQQNWGEGEQGKKICH